jgi:hypothetical protein
MSDGGDREGEIIAGFAAEVEITQKRTKRGNQRLSSRGSTFVGTFEKKVANRLRCPLIDILSERLDQLSRTASVLPQSRFLYPTMRLKPVAEGGHESWLSGQDLNSFARADSATYEMLMKELHPKTRVIAYLSSFEMRASATPKMAAKWIKCVEIDTYQNAAIPLNEAAEMDGGTEISNRTGPGVSASFEVICESIDVQSSDSTPQASQRLGGGEKLL